MRKTYILRLINRLLVAGIFLSISACGHKDEDLSDKLPVQKVKIQKVKAIKEAMIEEIPGSVRPKLKASLEAKVSGRIERMLASEGQKVSAGQLLAELDVQEIKAKVDQAKAMKEQSEKDLQRFASLLQQKAATQSEYDGIEAKTRVARGSYQEAQTILNYAQITAPFDGVITRKFVDVGDLAAPGKPLLELEDITALRFEANIPESFISKVKIGDVYNVSISNLPNEISGSTSEVAPTADPNSRTSVVKLDLPQAPELRSGQFGHLLLPVRQETIIKVPNDALVRRGQMEIVFVVQNGRAMLRLVRSGKLEGDCIQILSGLNEGEDVVVEGASVLKDMQRVEVQQ